MTFPSIPRRWFALYLLAVWAVVVFFALHHVHNLAPLSIGDYLINYSGGFVRRGLPGELILLASHATHVEPAWFVFALQTVAFSTFFLAIFLLTRGIRWSYALTALLLSPALIPFGLLNPSEGMRKEILLYAVLGLLCLQTSARLHPWRTILLLTIAAPALILSHDLTVAYMPYLFTAAAFQLGGLRRSWKLLLLPAATTVAAAIAIIHHSGNHTVAQAICSSIGGKLYPFGSPDTGVCSGSILWLTISFPEAHNKTMMMINTFHYFRIYGFFFVLVFAPVVILLRQLWKRPATRYQAQVLTSAALLAAVLSTPLFYAAYDWGRWMAVHLTCLTLLLLYITRNAPAEPAPAPLRKPLRLAATFVVVLYATLWALPPVAPLVRNKSGYPGLYFYFRDLHPHA